MSGIYMDNQQHAFDLKSQNNSTETCKFQWIMATPEFLHSYSLPQVENISEMSKHLFATSLETDFSQYWVTGTPPVLLVHNIPNNFPLLLPRGDLIVFTELLKNLNLLKLHTMVLGFYDQILYF